MRSMESASAGLRSSCGRNATSIFRQGRCSDIEARQEELTETPPPLEPERLPRHDRSEPRRARPSPTTLARQAATRRRTEKDRLSALGLPGSRRSTACEPPPSSVRPCSGIRSRPPALRAPSVRGDVGQIACHANCDTAHFLAHEIDIVLTHQHARCARRGRHHIAQNLAATVIAPGEIFDTGYDEGAAGFAPHCEFARSLGCTLERGFFHFELPARDLGVQGTGTLILGQAGRRRFHSCLADLDHRGEIRSSPAQKARCRVRPGYQGFAITLADKAVAPRRARCCPLEADHALGKSVQRQRQKTERADDGVQRRSDLRHRSAANRSKRRLVVTAPLPSGNRQQERADDTPDGDQHADEQHALRHQKRNCPS